MNANERKFDAALAELWARKTYPLKQKIWKKQGRPSRLTGDNRAGLISDLVEVIEDEMLKSDEVKILFKKGPDGFQYKKQWHHRKGKPHGLLDKKKTFAKWYDDHITTTNCVYIFWNQKECLYVGRTENGSGRPTQHFAKKWCKKTTRIDVYGFDRRREIARFECLADHKYDPKYSKITPSHRRYYIRCPICKEQEHVSNTMRNILRFK